MGSYLSRSNGEIQELDISTNSAYRYPPKAGNYFSSHFIMGGNKFETMQPEAYLFGENSDLNFLGPKPHNVPYKVSSPSQPVRALRCLVNIRKDSLRLVKVPSALNKTVTNEDAPVEQDRQIIAEDGEGPFLYNIEFTFDADCPCSITIYYNATEEMFNKNIIYAPDPARDCSDTVHFNPGCNQQFCLPTHRIDPAKLTKSKVDWTKGYTKIPIVIQVCADCGPTVVGHSHITYAEFYKPSDSTWSIRTVKQKQAIDGVCYLIQEIFGIENKAPTSQNTNDNEDDDDNDLDDDGSDCVVCLSETRDTLILPCKHLCLCSSCANQLRYQQSGCPICRQSFRALLQIRAVRKKTNQPPLTTESRNSERRDSNTEDNDGEDEAEVIVPVPPGYQVVPLIEAIKGDVVTSKPRAVPSLEPSTSVTNVTVVDETVRASTPDPSTCPSTSSGNVIQDEDVTNSDSDADEPKIHPESPVLVKEVAKSANEVEKENEDQQEHEENSEHEYAEIGLSVNEDQQEHEETPEHDYTEISLSGVSNTEEIGTESTESQKSIEEHLPETEENGGTASEQPSSSMEYQINKDGSIEI
uniref:E3 ubiquitin-protein ligase MGRN1-like isoform X1 n=1 Tax=Styela clava TaxID=7725 RepID=UPI001939D7A6|nr:E3 ubiquitin-protein ligase MGRN1-like isoform X1 [Styela clava]